MLCDTRTCHVNGLALEPEAQLAIESFLEAHPDETVWSSDHLRADVSAFPLSHVAGVLSIQIRLGAEWVYVHFTRIEHAQEVIWGGNPEKPVERMDAPFPISPRRSFEKWVEKRLGYSQPWENETRLLAFKLRELLLNALRP